MTCETRTCWEEEKIVGRGWSTLEWSSPGYVHPGMVLSSLKPILEWSSPVSEPLWNSPPQSQSLPGMVLSWLKANVEWYSPCSAHPGMVLPCLSSSRNAPAPAKRDPGMVLPWLKVILEWSSPGSKLFWNCIVYLHNPRTVFDMTNWTSCLENSMIIGKYRISFENMKLNTTIVFPTFIWYHRVGIVSKHNVRKPNFTDE